MSETDQLRAVGPDPTVADLFVGALLFSTSAEVLEVARFVDVEDVDEPGQAVLESVVALARRGVPPSSQLVLDDLKRCGEAHPHPGTLACIRHGKRCLCFSGTGVRRRGGRRIVTAADRIARPSPCLSASASYSEVEIAKLAETVSSRLRLHRRAPH